jgi:hypothetical protein
VHTVIATDRLYPECRGLCQISRSLACRSSDTATNHDIGHFQLAQVEQGVQPPTMNTQASVLRSLAKPPRCFDYGLPKCATQCQTFLSGCGSDTPRHNAAPTIHRQSSKWQLGTSITGEKCDIIRRDVMKLGHCLRLWASISAKMAVP